MSAIQANINQINPHSPLDTLFNYNSQKSNSKSVLRSSIINSNNIDTASSENSKNKSLNVNGCSYPFCSCYNCKINFQRDSQNKKILKGKENTNMLQNILETNDTSSQGNIYNPKKITNKSILDNCFKEHLKSGLQSVMKRDFKNLQIETSERIVPKDSIINNNKGSPFIGRTTNSIMYPEFIVSPKRKKPYISEDLLKIPFSGRSSYKENYEKFDDRYYTEKILPFLKKDNLETIGKLITETTTKETYKNIQPNNNKETPRYSFKQLNSYSILGMSPPQAKDSYLSQYKRSYIFDNENANANANAKTNDMK